MLIVIKPNFMFAYNKRDRSTFTDPEVVKYAGGVMSEQAIKKKMSDWTKRGGDGCIGICGPF